MLKFNNRINCITRFLVMLFVFIFVFNGAATVIASDNAYQDIHFEFHNLTLTEKMDTTIFHIDGAPMNFLQNNHYIVPTTVKTFTYPAGTFIKQVRCEPKNIHKQDISCEVAVAPSFVSSERKQSNDMNANDHSPQSIQSWFDYNVGYGIVNNTKSVIVTVQIFPVQYNPINHYINWAEEISIYVDYTLPKNTVLADEEYMYIIIAPHEFSDTANALVAHKNNRGISTKLITLDEIYMGSYFPIEGRDQQEQIKYFIKNAYDQWGISYVLLVGGSDFFPVRESHLEVVDEGRTYTCVMVSDLYYADLYDEHLVFSTWDTNENDIFGEYNWNDRSDDLDLYPDVHIGRLPCKNNDELESVIQKIILYENNEAYTKDWFSKFVVIGGDSAPGDDENIDEGEYATEMAINTMNGFVPVRIWASNADLYSKMPMNNALNDGAGFSYFSGHGHRTIWSTHPHDNHNIWLPPGSYSSGDVGILNNEEKLPIVILDACYVGQFDKEDDCFSWSFLRNQDGGCIGIFSSTYTSFFYPTSYVTEDIIGKLSQDTIKGYKIDGAITLGEMWTNALLRYISPTMDGADYFTVEEWLLMGDPTLQISKDSTPPEKPTITGPSNGKVGEEFVFQTSTKDIDGDKLYYLFDWGDGHYSEWIGPYNSMETVELSHTWDEEGSYQIRVMAKDDHGVQSEWSDPLSISMPKAKVTLFVHFIEIYLQHFPIFAKLLHTI